MIFDDLNIRKKNQDCIESSKISWLNLAEIFLIERFYQTIFSPFIGRSCRFHPTCSNYGIDALRKYSFVKANTLILWRILRCQPFCKGGYDPA